jgi:GT2 family glycosyltransferase/glycosyltransferase involved in cell wall biosynthesis
LGGGASLPELSLPVEHLPATRPSQPLKKHRNSLNILFVLYESVDSNGGLHVQLHASRLAALGAECRLAVPTHKPPVHTINKLNGQIRSFAQMEKDGPSFSDGRGPDVIHAWTPREIVRVFCQKMLKKYPCPLIIHLEDNESYLTEVAVGMSIAQMEKIPEKELDKLIPENYYHPIKGQAFLTSAQGLTQIIDTLSPFNLAEVPIMVLPPPVDERIFYPRSLNLALRKKLGIPNGHLVLTYTGNVHAANRDEVLELYRAVHLLNEQGCPTTLIRTGVNGISLGDESWITAHEKKLGWVERNRIPDILAAADILVQPGIPSLFNDQRFPSKLLEYFSICRPVVLPRTNLGIKIKHMVEGYVLDRANAENIAQAVQDLAENKEMAGNIAMGGLAFYHMNQSFKNSAPQLLQHYLNITNKKLTELSEISHDVDKKEKINQGKTTENNKTKLDNSIADDIELIRNSGLFNPAFYCKYLPANSRHCSNPLFHFCHQGWREGFNPSAKFSVSAYLQRYPFLKTEDINPVVHYLLRGLHLGYDPTPIEDFGCRGGLFDIDFYRKERIADLKNNNEIEHFLRRGVLEGSSPNRRVAQNRLMRNSLKPLISILMPVYNTPSYLLLHAVESVLDQVYEKWELLIEDDRSTKPETIELLKKLSEKDTRIIVERNRCNKGISSATNNALKRAKGEFVAMLDHDDILTPDCLLEVVLAYNRKPETDVFYTDQSYVDDCGNITYHHYKPDWSPWFFRGVMYVGHLLVVRYNLAVKIGGFNSKFDFVQDFEFMLRLSEHTSHIFHIPKALYHWRQCENSVAGGGKNEINFGKLQSEAVNRHLKRINFPVLGRVHPKNAHRLVLEPTEDGKNVPVRVFTMPTIQAPRHFALKITEQTKHKNVDWIHLTQNDLNDPSLLNNIADDDGFEYWAFINDWCKPKDDGWLSQLLSYAMLPGVGAVGPMIIGLSQKVASAGMAYTGNGIRHIMHDFDPFSDGYAGSLSCLREVSLLSPDCIVLRKNLLCSEHGLIPEYGLSYNLLDVSFRGRRQGFTSLLVPYVMIGGFDPQYSKMNETGLGGRFWMNHRSNELALDDPFYNRNLNADKCDYTSVDQSF